MGNFPFVERDYKTAFEGKEKMCKRHNLYYYGLINLHSVQNVVVVYLQRKWRILKSAQYKVKDYFDNFSYYIFQTDNDLILRLLFLIFISLYNVGIPESTSC